MALMNVTNVVVDSTPKPIQDNINFEVTFEVLGDIPDTVEWKLTYIGAKKDNTGDQTLIQFEMGPLNCGVMQFTLESGAPNYGLVPLESIFDVTALLISVSYHEKEFFRLGYYMHHQYSDEALRENPPDQIQWDKLQRVIVGQKPIITKIQIEWVDQSKKEQEVIIPLVPIDNTMVTIVDPFAGSSYLFDQLEGAHAGNENTVIENAWGKI